MKSPLKKETIRFYSADTELIRQAFPGGYGSPGINEVIREVIHRWVEETLIPSLPSEQRPEISVSTFLEKKLS